MEWYLKVLRQYADFSGRARRKEYWMFVLFNILFATILGLVDQGIGTFNDLTGYGMLSGIYTLVILIPAIAVGVRRLHDVGKSGWMLLIGLIPLIGFIWLLVLFVTDSDPGTNKYGPNPKGVG